MSLETPIKIRILQRKLYRKAKAEPVGFSDAVVFGELGVLRLRHVHLGPPPTALR